MIVFDVELLHGTYRADPDGSAATGRHARGEWPPSPARLLAALISTTDPDRLDSVDDVEALAAAPAPLIGADSGDGLHSQLLHGRYVASQHRKKGQVQEYPAREGVLVRPGVRVTPRSPHVRYLYDLDLDDATFDMLKWRAARVGYLGCADSPVCVTVRRVDPPAEPPTDAWTPDTEGRHLVNTHREGDVSRWQAAHEAWATSGTNRRQMIRHQPKTAYSAPRDLPVRSDEGTVVVWVSLVEAVPARKAVLLTHCLKQAAISHYQRSHAEVPSWVHGHATGPNADDYQLARFLALPFVGHPHATGRIHGAAVWAPPGAPPEETKAFAQALRSITELRLADGSVVHINRSRGSWSADRRRWEGPALRWTTVLPAVSDRHPRIDAGAVARWCEQAGLPAPAQCRISRVPLLTGAVDLHPIETGRPGRPQTRPYAHISVTFDEPVRGPVVIGAARSYGLGLCAPDDPPTA